MDQMENQYKGVIVEESLEDNRLINDLKIVSFRISQDENPADRWHLYTVLISDAEIENLSHKIKTGWYAHFWQDRDIRVIFRNKTFKFNYDDKSTWKPAVDYGLKLGIPKEQLDFLLE